jgi:hypothetical protein
MNEYVTREPHGGGSDITINGEWKPGERAVYSWVDGVPHVCAYRQGMRVVFHRATNADRTAMYNGEMSYDPVTCPTSKAWANHVNNGGD